MFYLNSVNWNYPAIFLLLALTLDVMSQQLERIVTFLWGSWCLQGSQKSAQGSQHFNDDFLALGSQLHCGSQNSGSQHCDSQHVSVEEQGNSQGLQGLHIVSNGDWQELLNDS